VKRINRVQELEDGPRLNLGIKNPTIATVDSNQQLNLAKILFPVKLFNPKHGCYNEVCYVLVQVGTAPNNRTTQLYHRTRALISLIGPNRGLVQIGTADTILVQHVSTTRTTPNSHKQDNNNPK
jgi:hypothetical protein